MIFGYARISRQDQNLRMQVDALESYGCDRIFTDVCSGAKSSRPGFDDLQKILRAGDTIVIWKLDRLGRTLKHLVTFVEELSQNGIGLVSLNSPIDTTSAQGRLIFGIFACIAEFERELIKERTNAGLSAARARGRVGGRKPGLSEDAKRKARIAESYYREGMAVNKIAQDLNIAKSTLYTYLRYRGVAIGNQLGIDTPTHK